MVQNTSSAEAELIVAGLFAGIGGLELGFERSGAKTRLLCEIDPDARRVLRKRFPDIPIVDDIRSIKRLPNRVNVVTAGFPCQDLSMAGGKSGIHGSASSIVQHLFDLLSKSEVEWVVIENVYFMLQLDHGRGIRVLADRLEGLGYRWAYRVIDTISFLPQRRRRVFMIGSLSHDPRSVVFDEANHSSEDKREFPSNVPLGFYWTEGRSGVGLTADAVPPLKAGSTIGIPSPPAILLPEGIVGTPSLADCERLQGFPAGWTLPALPQGKGHDQRWRLVGNAVSVPVARWIGKRIKRATRRPPVEAAGTPIKRGRAWPVGGYNVDGIRSGVQIGTIDALLAQLCVRHGLTMLTTDNDFMLAARHCDLSVWSAES